MIKTTMKVVLVKVALVGATVEVTAGGGGREGRAGGD